MDRKDGAAVTTVNLSMGYLRDRLPERLSALSTEVLTRRVTSLVIEQCSQATDGSTAFAVTPNSVGGNNMAIEHKCLDRDCQAAQNVWAQLTGSVVDLPSEISA